MHTLKEIYSGKKILLTGHTGFKGSWLAIWLMELGAEVIGYALDPQHPQDNFNMCGLSDRLIDIRGDIRDYKNLNSVFDQYKPDMVFHLAAQPLVRLSYDMPVETYEVNVMGTIHVMECMRHSESCHVGIMITTDKCYENREQLWGYREDEAMGGYDPYSSSKGAAEIAISSWRRSFFHPDKHHQHGKSIASARAGNVIGGGDWAQDRIIPDCIRALEAGRSLEIRSPRSIRPWQHVLEPLSGYLLLGKRLLEQPREFCEAWNFGPLPDSVIPVWDLAEKLIRIYGEGSLLDVSNPADRHEAQLLALDISKARYRLGWSPRLNIDQALRLTAEWYRDYRSLSQLYDLCVKQIHYYNDAGATHETD